MTNDAMIHGRWPLHRLHIHVAATRTTGEAAVCKGLLDALVRHGLEPDAYDTDESLRRPFVFGDALRELRGAVPQPDVFLRRRRAPSYDSRWYREHGTKLTFAFGPSPQPMPYRQIADLADEVASATEPDFSALVPYADLHPGPAPLSGDDAAKSLLDRGCLLPSRYNARGVGGLGYRTYVGPLVAGQLGEERISALPPPITVEKTTWGGWRIDLAPDPWAAEWPVIRASYEAAMERLKPANWFASPFLDERGFWQFTPPTAARWSPNPIKF
jgi:hypothetical protein